MKTLFKAAGSLIAIWIIMIAVPVIYITGSLIWYLLTWKATP